MHGCGQAAKAIHCPTCRKRTAAADIAYVDARRTAAAESAEGLGPAGALASGGADEEQRIVVRGSYGSKVRASGPDSSPRNIRGGR